MIQGGRGVYVPYHLVMIMGWLCVCRGNKGGLTYRELLDMMTYNRNAGDLLGWYGGASFLFHYVIVSSLSHHYTWVTIVGLHDHSHEYR